MKRVLYHILEPLEIHQKYSTMYRILTSPPDCIKHSLSFYVYYFNIALNIYQLILSGRWLYK